ncbi:MAG: type I-C CRISPR-associated protein Cas8c/Csd1, partial [Firmicutes bacterium]|nr:type I-C CRISPR-associated protein Cas8c/Csd1 [Bacillota bacterium]
LDSAEWHPWWRRFRATLKGDRSENGQNLMRCLETGELVRPAKTHPKIKGLVGVGGQAAGCVLIGFDKEAFTSYGLEQSDNAAVSEEAAAAYVNALNELIEKADKPMAGTMLVYWFKEQVKVEDDPLNWVKGIFGSGEAEELEALQRARRLVEGINTGQRPDLARNVFHAAVISASGGRVMVRDWMEGNFAQLARNVIRWFDDLEICSRDGTRLAKDPGLFALLFSLVRKELDELPPFLAADMWRAALFDGLIPSLALSTALGRIRADIVDSDKVPSPARMGLVKAYHIRKTRLYGGECSVKPYLNEEHPSAAYQAGRLMAALAAVQRAALGDVGAGIVQRYYAAASSTPALVLGRLIRQSQFHLNKLDKGLSVWYERLIAEITGRFGDGLPTVLDPEGQSLFALGYYQQMAALYGGKQNHVETKEETANE